MTLSRTLALIACAAALLGGSTAAAADPFINDLRVNLGFSLTDNGELSVSGDCVHFDSNTWFLDVQYMKSLQPLQSWGGLIYGGELFYSATSGDFPSLSDLDIDVKSYGVQGYFGFAHALANLPQMHFEATPFLGLGMANTKLSGSESSDDNALLIQYGLRVAGYYTFATRWQTGLELRHTLTSKTEPTLVGLDAEIENDGFAIVLGGGYRF